MEIMSTASVAGITVICWLAAEAVKQTLIDTKWLPTICGVLGAVLGVAGMHIIPDYPANDIITAIAVGILAGLAATGADQAVKQIYNNREWLS